MKRVFNLLIVICLFSGIAVLDGCKKKADPPTVTTTAITGITVTTAASGGNVTSDGGAQVTARGVCWGTSTKPTITGSKTSDGNGKGTFTSSLTGLSENTLYYVRAYATNSEGTAYGNELTFTTSQVVGATVTTTIASAVTATTATSGGNITADGGASITARGVCWATTADPTTTNDKTSDATGTGSFTSSLTGLTPNTTYHIRAYATNSFGTTYGSDVTFTTLAGVPTLTTTTQTGTTSTTTTSGGNITSDGGAAVTARGVCWGTATGPTVEGSHTTDGTGTGTFTSSVTGLTAQTTYYLRAYATNSAGTGYGNEITFTTTNVVMPTVTTALATNLTQTTATSGGNVTSAGGGTVTARGVCWGTAANPTVTDSHTTDGTGEGAFTSSLTGLVPGTTYHVRAYATNSAGTAYGNEVTFDTNPVTLAILTTTVPTSLSETGAASGGNITSAGGGTITARGVCWSTSANPTTDNDHTTDGTGTGVFTSSMTGMTAGTIYYVRAFATNSAGTAYGNQITFGTLLADVEGNLYHIALIGDQVWMTENLKTTKFSNNADIANVTDNAAWAALTTAGYCWYANLSSYGTTYGALYNWFAANSADLCPTGWHVPTDVEFNALELHLGSPLADINNWGWRGTDQGTQMKTTTGWNLDGNGTNTSGLSVLPAGYRYYLDGTFNGVGNFTYFWTNTENSATVAWYRRLDNTEARVYRAAVEKQAGKSIRCVKD